MDIDELRGARCPVRRGSDAGRNICNTAYGGEQVLSLGMGQLFVDYTRRENITARKDGAETSDDSEVELIGLCKYRAERKRISGSSGKSLVFELLKRCVAEGGAVERDGQWIEFIPICQDGHWGVIFIMRDGPGSAMVGWGDAMHLSPPKALLNVIVDLYDDVYDRWMVSVDVNENWMEKTL